MPRRGGSNLTPFQEFVDDICKLIFWGLFIVFGLVCLIILLLAGASLKLIAHYSFGGGGVSNHGSGGSIADSAAAVDLAPAVSQWLEANQLRHLAPVFLKHEVDSLPKCVLALPAILDEDERSLGSDDVERFSSAAATLKSQLVLKHWLRNNKWRFVYEPLLNVGVNSLQDLANYAQDDASKIEMLSKFQGNVPNLLGAKQMLPRSRAEIASLEKILFDQIVYESQFENGGNEERAKKYGGVDSAGDVRSRFLRVLMASGAVLVAWFFYKTGVTPKEILYSGVPLHKCHNQISWPDTPVCSTSKTMKVKVFSLQYKPIGNIMERFGSRINVTVEVIHAASGNNFSNNNNNQRQLVEATLAEESDGELSIIFSGQLAGRYVIKLQYEGQMLRAFPASIQLFPGKADASKTTLTGLASKTLVISSTPGGAGGNHTTLKVQPKDTFGNNVAPESLAALADRFSIGLWKRLDADAKRDELKVDQATQLNFVIYHGTADYLSMLVSFNEGQEGWYTAQINLDGQPIGGGADASSSSSSAAADLTLLVLNCAQHAQVNRTLRDISSNVYFEAEMLPENAGKSGGSGKKVYCYLTPRQFQVKEYFMKIIPRRLFSFRVVPSTKIDLLSHHPLNGHPVLSVGDGYQQCSQLAIKDGLIMVATYHKLLLNRIGGSDTLKDKRDFFHTAVVSHHYKKRYHHLQLPMTVDRASIVESTYKVTKWFTDADWVRLFHISFEGELGVDEGGLRREWFEILTKKIFHPSFGLFVQTEEGSEAVHPNPNPSPALSKKLYKLAGKIIGKCLSEPAYGDTYRLLLPARLAKSFLAQIVGLRVHYKHFADDFPEFYASKIRLILNESVEEEGSGLDDLTFTEDEYDLVAASGSAAGSHHKTVELKPGGSRIKVTNANKIEYLDALAQYKMCNRFRESTELFLDGLHTLIPDQLLSLFDESELELMLCGVREYDLADWKANSVTEHGVSAKTIGWFWLALQNFTSEQRAKLLQFSTGSSQLPPGGFSELKPAFQIAHASHQNANALPTAHTCFNMICLSDHNSYQDFEKALLTAITEGCEGFGFM